MRNPVLYLIFVLIFSCRPGERSGIQYTDLNLIPNNPGSTPGYYCTWGAQNYAIDSISVINSLDLGGHSIPAENLTQENFFGMGDGLLYIWEKIRKDLYVVFDAGWDVNPGVSFDTARWILGSFVVSQEKFPLADGKPADRLRTLNALVEEAGWKGAGIWIPAHTYRDNNNRMSMKELRLFYRDRALWSREADIDYWKVDYGLRGDDLEFRKMITETARQYHPDLWVEHSIGGGPLNDEECPWDTDNYHKKGSYLTWDDGRKVELAREVMEFADVFRTYDVTAQLSIPTTLDRAARILDAFREVPGSKGLINCEDEPYIGAVLGCALGIMRHPDMLEIEGYEYDPFKVKNKIDAVTRAVRWQRLSPAFSAGTVPVYLDETLLEDTWTFSRGDSWVTWCIGEKIMQAAPARVSRGMVLPRVESRDNVPPFVIASKHPNGNTSVATLSRVSSGKGFYHPAAEVEIPVDSAGVMVGIFGKYHSLVLSYPENVEDYRILAQDLAGDRAVDITEEAKRAGNLVILSGELIDRTGRSAAGEGDLSDPGLVLTLLKE